MRREDHREPDWWQNEVKNMPCHESSETPGTQHDSDMQRDMPGQVKRQEGV